jgi:hypothetical protein
MKKEYMNMKTTIKLLIALLAIAALGFGQTILSTTTLGAAITTTNGTSLTLASTSTMANAGPVNQINTCLYIDAELFGVVTVTDSTHVVVQQRGRGCGAIGEGARPTFHANGATVYFANTVTTGTTITPAASYIGVPQQITAENLGSCTATSELVLPRIYYFSGQIFDCLGGHWVQTNGMGLMVYGSTVASPAGVMTPTGIAFKVSGTNAITGITVPNGWAAGMSIYVIPTGIFTWTTATNISLAGTAVVGKVIVFTWDGAKWNPSVVA